MNIEQEWFTYNMGYTTAEKAHLDIAFWLSTGEISADRKPKVAKYKNRIGETKFKVLVMPRTNP